MPPQQTNFTSETGSGAAGLRPDLAVPVVNAPGKAVELHARDHIEHPPASGTYQTSTCPACARSSRSRVFTCNGLTSRRN